MVCLFVRVLVKFYTRYVYLKIRGFETENSFNEYRSAY
ncbi:hypothetical protein MOOTH_00450 [Moorella thermoacetica]|nr:hypothetical protein MOOTH_00450 [Moorella thermoacetica]